MKFTTFILILLRLLTYTQALPQPSTSTSLLNLDSSLDLMTLKKRALEGVWCCCDMPDTHGWLPTANENAGVNIDHVLSTGTVYIFPPHSCTPITCVAQASITLCNDADASLSATPPQIASYAGAVQDVCGWHGNGFCGQAFATLKFNVILRAQNYLG